MVMPFIGNVVACACNQLLSLHPPQGFTRVRPHHLRFNNRKYRTRLDRRTYQNHFCLCRRLSQPPPTYSDWRSSGYKVPNSSQTFPLSMPPPLLTPLRVYQPIRFNSNACPQNLSSRSSIFLVHTDPVQQQCTAHRSVHPWSASTSANLTIKAPSSHSHLHAHTHSSPYDPWFRLHGIDLPSVGITNAVLHMSARLCATCLRRFAITTPRVAPRSRRHIVSLCMGLSCMYMCPWKCARAQRTHSHNHSSQRASMRHLCLRKPPHALFPPSRPPSLPSELGYAAASSHPRCTRAMRYRKGSG
jgi:hypothetical protein